MSLYRSTNGIVIGPQYQFRVEFWTKVGGLDHKVAGPCCFNDLGEAEDWLRENWQRLKAGDGLGEWWSGCEMRSWDDAQTT